MDLFPQSWIVFFFTLRHWPTFPIQLNSADCHFSSSSPSFPLLHSTLQTPPPLTQLPSPTPHLPPPSTTQIPRASQRLTALFVLSTKWFLINWSAWVLPRAVAVAAAAAAAAVRDWASAEQEDGWLEIVQEHAVCPLWTLKIISMCQTFRMFPVFRSYF